jgi:chromate transporter
MSAITAAVVGVILNVAVWFAVHTLFREVTVLAAGPLRLELPLLATVILPSALLVAASASRRQCC